MYTQIKAAEVIDVPDLNGLEDDNKTLVHHCFFFLTVEEDKYSVFDSTCYSHTLCLKIGSHWHNSSSGAESGNVFRKTPHEKEKTFSYANGSVSDGSAASTNIVGERFIWPTSPVDSP